MLIMETKDREVQREELQGLIQKLEYLFPVACQRLSLVPESCGPVSPPARWLPCPGRSEARDPHVVSPGICIPPLGLDCVHVRPGSENSPSVKKSCRAPHLRAQNDVL